MNITINENNSITQRTLSATLDAVRYVLAVSQDAQGSVLSATASVNSIEKIVRSDNQEVESLCYLGSISYDGTSITAQGFGLSDTSKHIEEFTAILQQITAQKGGEQ